MVRALTLHASDLGSNPTVVKLYEDGFLAIFDIYQMQSKVQRVAVIDDWIRISVTHFFTDPHCERISLVPKVKLS